MIYNIIKFINRIFNNIINILEMKYYKLMFKKFKLNYEFLNQKKYVYKLFCVFSFIFISFTLYLNLKYNCIFIIGKETQYIILIILLIFIILCVFNIINILINKNININLNFLLLVTFSIFVCLSYFYILYINNNTISQFYCNHLLNIKIVRTNWTREQLINLCHIYQIDIGITISNDILRELITISKNPEDLKFNLLEYQKAQIKPISDFDIYNYLYDKLPVIITTIIVSVTIYALSVYFLSPTVVSVPVEDIVTTTNQIDFLQTQITGLHNVINARDGVIDQLSANVIEQEQTLVTTIKKLNDNIGIGEAAQRPLDARIRTLALLTRAHEGKIAKLETNQTGLTSVVNAIITKINELIL